MCVFQQTCDDFWTCSKVGAKHIWQPKQLETVNSLHSESWQMKRSCAKSLGVFKSLKKKKIINSNWTGTQTQQLSKQAFQSGKYTQMGAHVLDRPQCQTVCWEDDAVPVRMRVVLKLHLWPEHYSISHCCQAVRTNQSDLKKKILAMQKTQKKYKSR